MPPDPEVVILQGQRGHVLPGEVFLLHYFLQGCLQTIPLLTEFHREVLNDGVIPASAREISSEKSKDLLEHHMDDQNGLLLLELLWLSNPLRDLEVRPVLEAILRGSIQLPQEVLTSRIAVSLLESK